MQSEEQKEQERNVRDLCNNIKMCHICIIGSLEEEGIEMGPKKSLEEITDTSES